MEKKLLTKEEVAELFQVSTKTIRAWIKEKDFPSIKIGTLVRFDVEAVNDWINERRK